MRLLYFQLTRIKKNPPLLLGATFFLVILIGAGLLMLPQASPPGERAKLVDALFTSASATCVTGLIVRNTAVGWTTFGKGVILTLIQIGGLGTMTIIAMLGVVLKRKIGLQERLAIKEQLNSLTMSGMVRLIKYVVSVSFTIEFIGALLLAIRFIPQFGWRLGIGYAVFHSISAFCNAGFDILGSSMVPYYNDLLINLVITTLVIVGGLGFGVYVDIYNKKKLRQFTIHTRLVLGMTVILLGLGTFLIFLFESENPATLGSMSFGGKWLASFFQSTVTRTAGFNSIPMDGLSDATSFLMIILMFIGGSPGSTAGGLKTTTFGVLLFTVISTVKGEEEVVWRKRTIPRSIIQKTFVIAFVAIFVVIFATSMITIFENNGMSFLDILFEATSAFGTVGLSKGITENLSTGSKLILTLTMYLGRVGPTTMALGIGKEAKKRRIRYAEGNIIVG